MGGAVIVEVVQLSVTRKNPRVSINDIMDSSFVDNICVNVVFSGVPVKVGRLKTC